MLTVSQKPSFAAEKVSEFIRSAYNIDGKLTPLLAEWDQNFLLDTGLQEKYVVKIANCGIPEIELDFQNALLAAAGTWKKGKCPAVVTSNAGKFLESITDENNRQYYVRVLTYISGTPLSCVQPRTLQLLESIGAAAGAFDSSLAGFAHPAMKREQRWDLRRLDWLPAHINFIPDRHRRGIVERLYLQYRARILPTLSKLPASVIHNDINDENLILKAPSTRGWKIAGLLDFGDALWTNTVIELAVVCTYAIMNSDNAVDDAVSIVRGYHSERPLSEEEIAVLFPLICMRLCVSVVMSAIAKVEEPENRHRQISDKQAWSLLEQFVHVKWDEAENSFRQACDYAPIHTEYIPINRDWNYINVLEMRREKIGKSLSLSYKKPLYIIKGRGQFLFDNTGSAYLDCVNNVCHIGHSHPAVVNALAAQAALLNTNTRYLHHLILEYAKRLTETLPEPLKVCYFVNSGSEANELAVRLARTHTGRIDVIVVDHAYHGCTSTLVELSPYKAEGPGGKGLPEWVHKVPAPDTYRGRYRGMTEDAGCAYAEYVQELSSRMIREGRPPALFIVEPIMSCAGHIVPPPAYLQNAFSFVRSAGGLCVVDEVQVGFGRVGTSMWAFQAHGVVPDIITLGKPIGNGHPLGAVITTPEIAQSFANGMEFFSTFGGNPVSSAVGLAVLDVILNENLQNHAARVGAYLMQGFRTLAEQYHPIGDVRGMGMFIGVEFVKSRDTLEPAADLTAQLVEFAKNEGVLLSAEGPYHNVIKIKPPLTFAEPDADLLLGIVKRGLDELL